MFHVEQCGNLFEGGIRSNGATYRCVNSYNITRSIKVSQRQGPKNAIAGIGVSRTACGKHFESISALGDAANEFVNQVQTKH
jgi:hypothetical protein